LTDFDRAGRLERVVFWVASAVWYLIDRVRGLARRVTSRR
jgi:hypothetical protein